MHVHFISDADKGIQLLKVVMLNVTQKLKT